MKGLDLFSGCGGFTIGMKDAGINTVAAIEYNPIRTKTFLLHSPNTKMFGDIRNVSFYDLGKIDVVYGGPPCQPFSTGGKRKGDKDNRDMVPYFIKAIEEIRPKVFVMENVPGLSLGNNASYFYKIISHLESLDYKIKWDILYAPDYGVPQKRKRLFIVGNCNLPVPTHVNYVTVNDVLPERVGTPSNAKVVYCKNPEITNSPHAGHIVNGGGRLIDRNKPCDTILASAGNRIHFFDDSGEIVEYHKHLLSGGKPRKGTIVGASRLSVEESAIIQTFPRDMELCGSVSAKYSQIGDAVPPLLAFAIAKEIVKAL